MEERKTYTDEELSAVLEKHRVMLAVGTFIMYAAVVVILGGTLACAVFEIEELRYSLYIGFFIAFVGAVISAPHSKAIKALLGEELVVGALKDAFEQVEYHPGWGLPASLIGSAGMLFPEPYEVSKGSDSVKAVYKGMSIAFSDVELCKTEEHQKADHEWETREVTLYKGQWLVCDFQSKLIPTIPAETIIGVRTPAIRKLAKEYAKDPESAAFLMQLPHTYYDENILHALLVAEIKDYDTCVKEVERFLPHVDNWAVCDIFSPKVFKKNRDRLIKKIKEWAASDHPYTCRFGMEMLMTHFLDEDFRVEYLEIPAAVHSEEYYVNMMIAWFYATALAKQWDAAVSYIEEKRLNPWTHNKTIQKARESYRITPEQKEYLKTLKV